MQVTYYCIDSLGFEHPAVVPALRVMRGQDPGIEYLAPAGWQGPEYAWSLTGDTAKRAIELDDQYLTPGELIRTYVTAAGCVTMDGWFETPYRPGEVGEDICTQLARYLDDQGLVTFDPTGPGGNVYIGAMMPEPDTAICIRFTGGLRADPKLAYETPTVQILVRGDSDPRTAMDLARSIYNDLQGLTNMRFVNTGDWIVSVQAVQSAPAALGTDDNGRHEFSLNFEIIYANTDRRA